jgi:hypothetical protein
LDDCWVHTCAISFSLLLLGDTCLGTLPPVVGEGCLSPDGFFESTFFFGILGSFGTNRHDTSRQVHQDGPSAGIVHMSDAERAQLRYVDKRTQMGRTFFDGSELLRPGGEGPFAVCRLRIFSVFSCPLSAFINDVTLLSTTSFFGSFDAPIATSRELSGGILLSKFMRGSARALSKLDQP